MNILGAEDRGEVAVEPLTNPSPSYRLKWAQGSWFGNNREQTMRWDNLKLFHLIVILSLGWAFIVQADDKPARKPGRTEISKAPWNPPTQPPGKVVYGTDDRHDVFQEADPDRRAWADSTCALVDASQLTAGPDGTFTLALSGYQIAGLPACEDEPFRDQPSAAYCTGFVVGPDLIATAGHCYNEFDLPLARFVFGFRMEDASIPRTAFDATEVYTGIEVVAHQLEGDFDYSIIRVDRTIEAPGARILRLRTGGTIPVGTRVGVIGHPAGLPTKIAFGETTQVSDTSKAGYFVANLDSFGGNSGSPVFNADTGVVEGILVRGEADFVLQENCFQSRTLPDVGDGGEESSKATTFAHAVQSGRGSITLDRAAYPCGSALSLSLFDQDLEGAGPVEVVVFTSGGDSESVTLEETGRFGAFSGTLDLASGVAHLGDGALQTAEGESIYATYRDADTGSGAPGDVVATARVDCTAPTISDITVAYTGGNRARIAFTTSEPTLGTVQFGEDCETLAGTASDVLTREHEIEVRGLAPLTAYFFRVTVTDPAGNTATDDNGGACFTWVTTSQRDYLTEGLFDGTIDLTNRSVTFTPDGSFSGYQACIAPAEGFHTSPFCGEALSLEDDGFIEYTLRDGKTINYFGETYGSFFVCDNGYVTFGQGDSEYFPTMDAHFSLPRISGYFGDLYTPAGGPVSIAELEDRVAISYYNVPEYYNGDLQSFQIEIFYDGAIRITWVRLTYPYAIVGLSDGSGLAPDFEESVLTSYPECPDSAYEDVECSVDVPNDACADAVPATVGTTYTGFTISTLGSNELPGCEHCYGPDVWYAFTPDSSGTYSFSLCQSGFDTVLEVFAGDCGALDFVGGNDDGICGSQSALAAELTGGQSYRVRISGYGAMTGSYEFQITRGAKAAIGCNADDGIPGNATGEALILALVVALLVLGYRGGARASDA